MCALKKEYFELFQKFPANRNATNSLLKIAVGGRPIGKIRFQFEKPLRLQVAFIRKKPQHS